MLWDGVGILKTDVTGEVVFEPHQSIVSYLQPVPAERVIRSNAEHTMLVGDRERTNTEMTDYLKEETVYVEKESWWIYALIIAAIALIVIFFHYYKTGVTSDSIFNQQKIDVER